MTRRVRKDGGGNHAADYERTKDGSLVVGPSCFSGPHLKRRFLGQDEADDFIRNTPGTFKYKVTTYECPSCNGWHMTETKSIGKTARQRRGKGARARTSKK